MARRHAGPGSLWPTTLNGSLSVEATFSRGWGEPGSPSLALLRYCLAATKNKSGGYTPTHYTKRATGGDEHMCTHEHTRRQGHTYTYTTQQRFKCFTLCGQGKGTCQDTSGKVHSRLRGQKLLKTLSGDALTASWFVLHSLNAILHNLFFCSIWMEAAARFCVCSSFSPTFFPTTPCPYNEACQKSRLRLYIKWPVVNVAMLLCQSSEVSSLPRHQIFVAPCRVCSHCAQYVSLRCHCSVGYAWSVNVQLLFNISEHFVI